MANDISYLYADFSCVILLAYIVGEHQSEFRMFFSLSVYTVGKFTYQTYIMIVLY